MKKLLTTLFSLLLILVLLPISITNNEVKADEPINEYTDDCITFSSDASFTLKTNNTSKNWDGTLWYSTDKTNWTKWNGLEIPAEQTGGTGPYNLYVRGDTSNTYFYGGDPTLVSSNTAWCLTPTTIDNIACSGNIETLRGATGNNPSLTPMANYCYAYLFSDCSSLTKAPSLPATTLADSCYKSMFMNCIYLTKAPSLPATVLADNCYVSMFQGCSRLKSSPELPATTLTDSCYSSMFYECSSLTTVPTLKATSLADYCYSEMFRGCSSLIVAPALPATSLAPNCYSCMFYECESLQEAPALPATSLADYCYSGMFEGCISLTQAPALPATTLANNCYDNMFSSCSSLTTAPALPATSLAPSCYYYMFDWCESLTTAPALPATTLVDSCYCGMFAHTGLFAPADMSHVDTLANRCCEDMYYNCGNIKVYEGEQTGYIQWKATSAETKVNGWSKGMFSYTGGDFTNDPENNKTYSISKVLPITYTCDDDVQIIKDGNTHSISINVTEPADANIQYTTNGGYTWYNYTSPIEFGPDYTQLTNIRFKITKAGYKTELVDRKYEIAYPIISTGTSPKFTGITGTISYPKGKASNCPIEIDNAYVEGTTTALISKKANDTLTPVASSNYTIASGSTVITLKDSYLNTLGVGTHTFKIDVTYIDKTYSYYLVVTINNPPAPYVPVNTCTK